MRSTHSRPSTEPVTKPMSGMLSHIVLWCWIEGIASVPFPMAVFTHDATLGSVTTRRQRPFWMTTGMFAPTGMSVMVNMPR